MYETLYSNPLIGIVKLKYSNLTRISIIKIDIPSGTQTINVSETCYIQNRRHNINKLQKLKRQKVTFFLFRKEFAVGLVGGKCFGGCSNQKMYCNRNQHDIETKYCSYQTLWVTHVSPLVKLVHLFAVPLLNPFVGLPLFLYLFCMAIFVYFAIIQCLQ